LSDYELAQLNIAHLLAPIDSPLLADFNANLDRINELAEQSPGFVWRLQTEEGNATDIQDFGEEYIVNISVWEDVASLQAFVYKTAHAQIMSRRKEWFNRMGEVYTVLWWIPKGHQPTTSEAKERLESIRKLGPTSDAFSFKNPYPKPGAQGNP
jgi:hypothetical protein